MSFEIPKPISESEVKPEVSFGGASFELEKKQVVDKYNVGNPDLLVKKDGMCFYKDQPVEEWDADMKRLEVKETNDLYHQN